MRNVSPEYLQKEKEALYVQSLERDINRLRAECDALRYAPTTQEPVAWLAAYVNNVGLPDHYVTTHHELAVENDANRSPKPLFFNPPAPQRVPLTDEEILTAAGRLPGWLRHHEELDADDLIDFARAIEAAIRITK